MKTTTSLIVLSAFATLTFSVPVFGQVKGGEKLAGVRGPAPTRAPISAMAAMKCPTETRTVVDPAGGRGAFKKVSVYTAHLCPSCKNAEVTRGAGKWATRTVEHSCQTATVCCNVKN
ncbi:MAG: hypothetical protein ACXW3L_06625 [Limisphaerales bacterium]